MAVKIPIDLAQNGTTRRALQQAINVVTPSKKSSGKRLPLGAILGGVVTATRLLRLYRPKSQKHKKKPTTLIDLLPQKIKQEGTALDQHIREGRFQRSLALITAFSGLLGGLEVTYEHYRGSYGQRIMYSPVLLTPALCIAAIWAVFSRFAARVILPIVSLITLADGLIGFFFHIRGIQRKPGGWRIPVFNLIMGPPLFAPLLFGLSGFLGLISAFLRREDAPEKPSYGRLTETRPAWARFIPNKITQEGLVFEQEIREGRFQRVLGVATAVSAFFSGFESLYSHYKNNFMYPVQWSPILLTPALMIAGFGAVFSRTMARTFLPIVSILALLDGGIGFLYHLRGILRRPASTKKLLYNIIYGPPIFAPLLFAASGFLGVLASLLRREA